MLKLPVKPPIVNENIDLSEYAKKSDVDAIDASLDNKAEKKEVEKLSEQLDTIENKKLNKTDILSMANMGQDVKEAMTGGSVAITGRYSVGDINLIDNSVTIDKLPPYLKEATENKVKIVNYDDISNGDIVVNDNNLTMSWAGGNSAIIQIQPLLIEANTEYYVHFDSKFSNNQIQFELRNDKNGENKLTYYIASGQVAFKLVKDTQFEINYIRISGSDVNYNGHIWIDKNKDSSYYPPYKSKIATTEDINNINNTLKNIDKENLSENLLDTFYNKGLYNLYNEKTATIGKTINCLGDITDNSSMILTDYIDVEDFFNNETIMWFKQSIDGLNVSNGNAGYIAVYDVNKSNICASAKQFYDIGYIQKENLPSGYKYIRVSFSNTYINFGIGTIDAPKYNYYVKKDLVDKSITDNLKEEIENLKKTLPAININKECIFYGDSITAQDLFQPLIKEVLGINYINDGNPGYPLSNVFANNNDHSFSLSSTYKLNNLINTINTNSVKYVFIMGGTNDFGYDGTKEPTNEGSFNAITMGDLSYPYNRNTYKGALSHIIDRIQRECATVEKVFIMSPIQRGKDNATDIVKNSLGLSMLDFRNACEEVANKFSCEFIDVYSCGINFINCNKYIPDKIHPNDNGALLMANIIIAYLKNMVHI